MNDPAESLIKFFCVCAIIAVVVVVATNCIGKGNNVQETSVLKDHVKYEEYDGHQYLVYLNDIDTTRASFGITHSPKCWCLTNKVEVAR